MRWRETRKFPLFSLQGAVLANFLSQGQVCSNAARVFVQRSVLSAFTARLVEAVKLLKVGDPFCDDTAIGAMISPQHGEKVMDMLRSALLEGARPLVGGERCEMTGEMAGGFFVPATVLENCCDDMGAVREEIFGPVRAGIASLYSFLYLKNALSKDNRSFETFNRCSFLALRKWKCFKTGNTENGSVLKLEKL